MIEQIYETICETNDKIIESGQDVATAIFFIKGEECKAHTVTLTKKNKNQIQTMVKELAIKNGVDGYIIIIDSNIRFSKTSTGEIINGGDCVVRTLYTPKMKIIEVVEYEDGKITNKRRILGREKMCDYWDAWNENEFRIQ